MKYILTIITTACIAIMLVCTGVYQRKKGYASGIEMGKLNAQGEYLAAKKKFMDSFYKAHQPEHDLVDSLTTEVLRQGQEAKAINRKLVKKFGL
jgi:hypothetical protein